MENQEGGSFIGFRAIMGFLVVLVFLVALVLVARGIFTILAWAAPVLIVLALLINYKTVVNFGEWLYRLLINNPLAGLLAIILSVIGFPVVAGFLFGKSLLDRKVKKLLAEQYPEDEYVDYEEVTDEPLELRQLEERRRENHENQ